MIKVLDHYIDSTHVEWMLQWLRGIPCCTLFPTVDKRWYIKKPLKGNCVVVEVGWGLTSCKCTYVSFPCLSTCTLIYVLLIPTFPWMVWWVYGFIVSPGIMSHMPHLVTEPQKLATRSVNTYWTDHLKRKYQRVTNWWKAEEKWSRLGSTTGCRQALQSRDAHLHTLQAERRGDCVVAGRAVKTRTDVSWASKQVHWACLTISTCWHSPGLCLCPRGLCLAW